MTDARVTRALQDVVGEGAAEVRVTRAVQDVVAEGAVEARVTRALQDVVGEGAVEARVTRAVLIVIADVYPTFNVEVGDVVGVSDELQRAVNFSRAAQDAGEVSDELLVEGEVVPLLPTSPRALPDAYDIANPYLVRDAGVRDPPPLGQYQINDRGDLAVDDHLQGLRKRILRRVSTARGGFFHLPEYGIAQPIKGPVRPGLLRALAVEAQRQVSREPEVLRAKVQIEQHPESVFVYVITVRVRTVRGLDVVASQVLDLRSGS